MQSIKKVKYNLILGIISEVVTIVLGIVVPRLILTSYGSEVNGLINSITQIYSYVALLEAGIGVATVQTLYKTIGQKNREETNKVLSATNYYYHRTGLLYFFAIVLFSIVYPMAIKTEIPTVTVVLIIVFNGLGSVISYLIQAKYFLLLQAEGKVYVKTVLTIATTIFKNAAKIILMALGCDVVFVQAIAMVVSIIHMLYVTWYIKKYYGWIDLKVEPDFSAISQSKNVLIHQISQLIFNSTDNIVLSFFCGLKTVSVYAMYNLFFTMITTAQTTVSGSVIFLLGQTYHSDKKRFLKLYDCYEMYYITLVFALYSVTNFFILPFMKLYTFGITDTEYIDKYLPHLFILISLLSCGRNAPNNVINFEGHFKQTQNRSILEAIINISVSIITVPTLGIYGVLIGTIVALLYRTNDIIIYANRKILKRSVWITYKRWLINFAVYCAMLYTNQFWKIDLISYKSIFLWVGPYTAYTFIAFFGIASLCELPVSKDAKELLLLYIRRKH